MIKKGIITIILILGTINLSAQELIGKWWLGIIEQASLPINLTFTTNDSITTAIFYSPLQTEEAIYPTKYEFKENKLLFEQTDFNIKIKLTYNQEKNTWQGTYKQRLFICPIKFESCDTLLNTDRPQTPKPPLPYIEEEVKVKRKKEKVVLTGTLTMPREGKNLPAVVLVNGSGQQNRDCEIMKHKIFAVIADKLTREGIAVLRYDDRGIGGSKGEVITATTNDFAEDAMAMTKWLTKHKRIDSKKIGIIGHSEGGLIAQIAASQMNNIAFIVMLAGPGCSGKDIILQQNEAILKLQGIDEQLIKIRIDYLESIINEDKHAEKILEPLSKEERKIIGLSKGDVIQINKQFKLAWMKTFLATDPSKYLPKVECPILALNGDKDCQVMASKNLANIKQLAPHAEIVELKNLNHMMQHCQTGSPNEYGIINETIAEEVMQIIVNWINELQK